MLEFKVSQELKPNTEILEIIKNYTYKVTKGKIKHLLNTNLQLITPTEYKITYPITLTILEYQVNEISSKPFYIKEYQQKYSLKEIKQILIKLEKWLHFSLFSGETYEEILQLDFVKQRFSKETNERTFTLNIYKKYVFVRKLIEK